MEINLEYIDGNPWQPRLNEDQEHVKELALSIARDGLMQAPVGRLVDANGEPCGLHEAELQAGPHTSERELWDEILGVMGCRIQLAFGHSRLAAYRWLLANIEEPTPHPSLKGGEEFRRIPVVLRDLDDETMARMAIEENVQRKDLNAIEEALAMLRLRNEFGMTAGQIGEIFGLADSSVRGKMRLLELPVEAQDALKRGIVSEGAGRELLRFYALGEEIRRKATVRRPGTLWDTVSAAEGAILGWTTAVELREVINQAIKNAGKNLHEAPWKWEQGFDLALDGALRAEQCKGCEQQMELEKRTYCVQPACYFAKRKLWIKARLAAASAACGIRAVEEIEHTGIQVDAEVRESGCANLRVVYHRADTERERAALVPGFEDCMIACGNRNGICTCANGLAARRVAAERLEQARRAVEGVERRQAQSVSAETPNPAPGEPTPTPSLTPSRVQAGGEEEAKPGPTSEELREAAREQKRKLKQDLEELQAMREDFARRIRDAAICDHNRFAWHILMGGGRYEIRYARNGQDPVGTIEEIAYRAALKIAEQETTIYSNHVNLVTQLRELNALLKAMGLREIAAGEEANPEPVYVPIEETPAEVVQEAKGRSLMEVFSEQEGAGLPGQRPGETLAEYWTRTDPSFAQGEEAEL